MLRKSLQLTVRHVVGITRVLNAEIQSSNIRLQKYGRYAPRHHATIVNEDELFDVSLDNTTQPKLKKEAKSKSKYQQINETKVKGEKRQTPVNILEENEDELLEDKATDKKVSTKLQANEKILSSIMMSLQSKKQRKKQDQILLEGVRLTKDAIQAGTVLETVIFSRWEDVNELNITDKTVQLYKVPYRSIQMWSTLTTAPGIMAIFKKPEPKKVSKEKSLPLTIICDNVRDPGNMGSILRAAAGVGCEKVLLTKGCVDFWDSKVVRSATGAHFRIPIFGSQEWDDIKQLLTVDAQVYVADSNCNDYKDKEALIEFESKSNEYMNKKYLERKKQKLEMSISQIQKLAVVPYFAVDYTQNEVILIVGGETEGLSKECFDLVEEKQGIRVNIPLDNGIDSLNAGVALGIVAFEVKRQFLRVYSKLEKSAQ